MELKARARRLRRRHRSGQATVEYILLLTTVALIYSVVIQGFKKFGFTERMSKQLSGPFARAYQYGHPEARGFDDGGPKNHPRAVTGGENNFRMFLNPEVK